MVPGSAIAIEITLLLHAFATWTLMGKMLFVQLAYQPLYCRYKKERSTEVDRTELIHVGYFVIFLRLLEFVTAVILVFVLRKNLLYRVVSYTNLSILIVIGIMHIFYQMKKKPKASFFMEKVHNLLLGTNILKTIAWSSRSILVFFMVLIANIYLLFQ